MRKLSPTEARPGFATRFSSPGFLGWMAAAASAMLMLLLARPLLLGQIYVEDDISAQYLPLRHFYAECLKSGESFLWIPNIFRGYYIHGEGEVGMCHPLHWLLYRFLDLTAALDLELLISYPFMFVGVFLLFRRWGFDAPARFFAAITFTFGGYCIAAYPWYHHMGVISHTPWLLLATDVLMRSSGRGERALASVAVTVLTASQLLLGYPQMIYVTGYVEGLYLLYLLCSTSAWRRLPLYGIAKVLAFGVGAVQLLPTMDLVSHSVRADTSEAFRMGMSLHPLNLLQLVSPYLFRLRVYAAPVQGGLYAGALTTVLVCWGALRWRRREYRAFPAPWFFAAALLGVVLAMGWYGGLYRLVSLLPIVSKFRAPVRHAALFHIAWVFLAAWAFAELSSLCARRIRVPWKELLPLFALPALSLVICGVVAGIRLFAPSSQAFRQFDPQFAPTFSVLAGAVIILMAVGLIVAAGRGVRLALPAMLLFLAADLAYYGLRHIPAERLDSFMTHLETPEGPPTARLAPNYRPVYLLNAPLMLGWNMADGYVSIPPACSFDYYVDTLSLRLAGVGWVRSRIGATPELAKAFTRGETWVPIPEPMPYARMLTDATVSARPVETAREIDIAKTAIVEHPVQLGQGPPGEAQVMMRRPGAIDVATAVDSRQLLVVAESFHEGWRAAVDGVPTPILRAYGDFMGCVVGAGRHTVSLRFEPDSFRQGLRVTYAAILFAAVWNVMLWRLGIKGTAGRIE